jgi:hypothetical protein
MLKFVLLLIIATIALSDSLVCPAGQVKTPRANFKPVTNGCGPQVALVGGAIQTVVSSLKPSFVSCCNIHDICYQDCSKSQKACDDEFKTCLLGKCSSVNLPCKLAGTAMYEAVNLFGKSSYDSGQKAACVCAPGTNAFQDLFKSLLGPYQGISFNNIFGAEEEEEEALEDTVDLQSFLETVTQ